MSSAGYCMFVHTRAPMTFGFDQAFDQSKMFGSDLLVAPMIEAGNDRQVYLPPGSWTDYQTGKVYSGVQWRKIAPDAPPSSCW